MKLNHLKKAAYLAVVFAFCVSLANAAPTATRDWDLHPAVVQVDNTTADVYVIGDAHADPGPLVGVLKAAGLIDSNTPANVQPTDVRWVAGGSILVVTGDMIDKGPNSLGVIALLRALKTSAAAAGGQVILLMGNHEAGFLSNWNGKLTEDFKKELNRKVTQLILQGKSQEADPFVPKNVADCQGDLGKFLCELPIAARVNDWFFSHAGNTKGQTIAGLNTAIKNGFRQSGFATTELVDENSILEARLNDKGPGGFAWFYEGNLQTDPQAVLRRNATALGVNHIVQGHQPGKVVFGDPNKKKPDDVIRQKGAIFQRYGLLFLIDTGMSSGVDGNESIGGALRINRIGEMSAIGVVNGPTLTSPASYYQVATVICANGIRNELWSGKSNQAIATQHCP